MPTVEILDEEKVAEKINCSPAPEEVKL